MKNYLEHIIKKTLLSEQETPADGAEAPTPLETDNAPSDAKDSPFTPAEERFLGKFDAYGSKHLGILYSTSDAGVREFVTRSGKELNVSPDILRSLFRKKIIKFVPYTGFGRNNDYTIELQLSLDDVKGLGKADQAKAETGSKASGAAPAGAAPPPENSGLIRHGHVLTEMINEDDTKTTSLIPKDELKRCYDAYLWWLQLTNATISSNWNEEQIIEALLDVKSRQAAIYIDAIGYIFTYEESSKTREYLEFIEALSKSKVFNTLQNPLTFAKLPISLEQPVYTIPRLLNSYDFLTNVFYDYLKDDTDYNKIKNLYAARGIGQLVVHSEVPIKSTKNPNHLHSKAKYFYPAYSTNDVWNVIKKLTTPFISKTDLDQRNKKQKQDLLQKKKKEKQAWISKQSEQVKQEIIRNKILQFKSYNGLYSDNEYWKKSIDKMYGWGKYPLTTIDDIDAIFHFGKKPSLTSDFGMSRTPIKFVRTYQDKAGEYYAAFRSDSSSDTIYRLYANGTITRDFPAAVGQYWTLNGGIYVEWSYDKLLTVKDPVPTPKELKNKNKAILSSGIKRVIENNKALYSKTYKAKDKLGQFKKWKSYKIPLDISKINNIALNSYDTIDIVKYKGTWVDSINTSKPYVWFKNNQGTIYKFFNDGSCLIIYSDGVEKRTWQFITPSSIMLGKELATSGS